MKRGKERIMMKYVRKGLLVLCISIVAVSCTESKKGTSPINFPKGFLWGVATAAEQSEGGNTQNDWYVWEQMGKTPPVGLADNFYDPAWYNTDINTVKSMGMNAFRLTFEWSRIVPNKPADIYAPLTMSDVDMNAVNHYHNVIDAMISSGLTPVVTLTHYTVPQWADNPAAYDKTSNSFTDGSLGGWTNTATAYAFANYAGFMAQEFSTTVKYWLTENEPVADVLLGYIAGQYPPGFSIITNLTAATMPFSASVVTVMKNMIMGHALAYHAIHASEPDAMVSFAKNSIFTSAIPGNAASARAADAFNHAYNLTYLDALTTGIFDTGLTGTTFTEVHNDWANTLDYIGVNFYSNDYVVPAPAGVLVPINALPCDPAIGSIGIPLSSLGCPAENPSETQGLTGMLLEYEQRYHLPILITENGDNSNVPLEKTKYIVQNTMAVHDAINHGAEMIGYLYWTLNYDYEWTSGYDQSAGLFYVDDFTSCTTPFCSVIPDAGTDFTRTPMHPATDVYSAIAAANGISPTIIDQYGH
jgi:beta-glucosidase/6-phospho-beta-glucosidase/beta-galactosidase